MAIDKKTLTIVTASTAIGFIGDVIIYSLGESKGGKFKIAFPKGMEAVKLLGLGIITGLVVDFAVKQVEKATQTAQEKMLADLVQAELERIQQGERKNLAPQAVLWKPFALTA